MSGLYSYRPSNGSEADAFCEQFCYRCRRDSEEHPCDILVRTLILDIDDEDYPVEWVQGPEPYPNHNPRCTAFESIVEPPDPRQMDLFGGGL